VQQGAGGAAGCGWCSRVRVEVQGEGGAAGCGWCSRVRVEVQGEGRCLHLPLGDGARHACDRLRLCEALCVPAVLERVEEALLLPLEGHLRVLCPLEDRRLVSRTSGPRTSVCRSLLSLCTRAETAGRPGASPHAGCRLGYTSATPRLHHGYTSATSRPWDAGVQQRASKRVVLERHPDPVQPAAGGRASATLAPRRLSRPANLTARTSPRRETRSRAPRCRRRLAPTRGRAPASPSR